MIDVPACDNCNGGSSELDQRFGVYLIMHGVYAHETAEEHFRTRILATLNKNKKLKRHILDGLKPVYSPSGEQICDLLLWDSVAYDAIMERTIRGLYFKHYQAILGNNATVSVQFYGNQIPERLIPGLPQFQHNEIGHDGEVVYKYLRDENNPFSSVWIFQFYKSLVAGGITKPI